MNGLSKNFEKFESELSALVIESSKIQSKDDLRNILIRLTSLQRIIYNELEQVKAEKN